MIKPWEDLKDAFPLSRQLTLTLVNAYAIKHQSCVSFNVGFSQVSPDEKLLRNKSSEELKKKKKRKKA